MKKLHVLLFMVAISVGLFAWKSKSRAADLKQQQQLQRLEGKVEELQKAASATGANASLLKLMENSAQQDRAPLAERTPPADDGSPRHPKPERAETEMTLEQRALEGERQVEALRDASEARFLSEGIDRSWSSDNAMNIRTEVLRHLAQGSRLQSLECRQTLCRLETSHPDPQTFREFQKTSLSSPEFGWKGAILFAPLPSQRSGEIVRVAYLSRPGYPPAQLEQE